ncbi:MAG TPA: Gfo/Idh/MocA family oxidoreductase [Candidatus Polarisedimenticolia bacterium]|nr:Gfo/Idh/MocA family oxidoreductase [Candidatus Polarisedimenticolia bacterium]
MSAEGRELRVAVVGVGHLGQHHARILSQLPGCRLVAVADRDAPRAREVAARHGVEALADAASLPGRVDAVTIAVPTEAHVEAAGPFLEAGAAVLVEKPIAASLAQADVVIEAARRAGALLGVGHTERFNPAVQALAARARTPRFIESHRLGSFAPRSLDIDVVLDLMIHDIDIVLDLVRAPVRSVEAVGVNALTPRVDIANARLVFENGCVANLTASRISASRTRKIRFFQNDSYLSCDCAERSLEHYRLERADPDARPAIIREQVEIPPDEPLRRELDAFMQAVRGAAAFAVPGEAGRAALAVALSVAERIAEGGPRPERS